MDRRFDTKFADLGSEFDVRFEDSGRCLVGDPSSRM